MLIVVDTNIIVSALLSPDSTAFTFLSEILDGKHTVLICEEILLRRLNLERILRRINFYLQGGRLSCSECYSD